MTTPSPQSHNSAELRTDPDTPVHDPRRAAFGKVPLRAPAVAPPIPIQSPDPTDSSVKPSASPVEDLDREPSPEVSVEAPPSDELVSPSSNDQSAPEVPAPPIEGEEDEDPGDEAENYGTRKGNLTYVSTSIPRELSDQLDQAAHNSTLGVVLMKMVRAHYREVKDRLTPEPVDPDDPFPAPQVRVFYRPPGGSIRRDIGVHPDEAAAIWRVSHDMGIRPSAFMRMVIELGCAQLRADEP